MKAFIFGLLLTYSTIALADIFAVTGTLPPGFAVSGISLQFQTSVKDLLCGHYNWEGGWIENSETINFPSSVAGSTYHAEADLNAHEVGYCRWRWVETFLNIQSPWGSRQVPLIPMKQGYEKYAVTQGECHDVYLHYYDGSVTGPLTSCAASDPATVKLFSATIPVLPKGGVLNFQLNPRQDVCVSGSCP